MSNLSSGKTLDHYEQMHGSAQTVTMTFAYGARSVTVQVPITTAPETLLPRYIVPALFRLGEPTRRE